MIDHTDSTSALPRPTVRRLGRRVRRTLRDVAIRADLDFLRYVREANFDTLLRLQKLDDQPLWRKIVVDRAVLRHVFGR